MQLNSVIGPWIHLYVPRNIQFLVFRAMKLKFIDLPEVFHVLKRRTPVHRLPLERILSILSPKSQRNALDAVFEPK